MDDVPEMARLAVTAARNDGNIHCFRNRVRQRHVVTLARTFLIDRGDQYLACPECHTLASPFDHVDARALASAVGVDLPSVCSPFLGFDGQHHALRSESTRDVADEFWS